MQVDLTQDSIPKIPGARIAIIQAKWYREYLDNMVSKCTELLKSAGCETVEHHLISGSLELPLAAKALLQNAPINQQYDAIICFGAVMKGETYHFELIMNECGRGLTDVMLSEGVPIIVEVIPVTNTEQLAARSKNDHFNKGIEAALAAAETIAWRRKIRTPNIKNLTATPTRIHIVAGFIHKDICEKMITSAHGITGELNAVIENVTWVPGSLETPLAVQQIIKHERPDAIVVFGVQQKGQTKHGEVIAHQTTNKLLDLQLKYAMPMAVAIIGPGATLRHATKKARFVSEKAMRAAVHMVWVVNK